MEVDGCIPTWYYSVTKVNSCILKFVVTVQNHGSDFANGVLNSYSLEINTSEHERAGHTYGQLIGRGMENHEQALGE